MEQTIENMYKQMGISDEVFEFCEEILKGLSNRFLEIDKPAE